MEQIFFNGNIITMDEACPYVEAVYIADGRIRKRGSSQEILALKEEKTVCTDLAGKTMLPGFIDGHSHFTGLANSLSQCDLSDAADFDEIIVKMKAFIEENQIPEGEWVAGSNYDHNFLKEKVHPDRHVLDRISENHPIVIVHASSHMGVANTNALRCQKLTAAQPDPEGGHYGREAGTGELSGYMEENAFISFQNQMPMISMDRLMNLMKKAQQIYASYGITTVQEGMVSKPLFQILQQAKKNEIFYLDLVEYLDLETCAELFEEQKKSWKGYENHVKIGGFKMFLDGSPQGRTAWMKEPYENAPDGYCGYPIKTDEKVYGLILTALQKGAQLLTHCNGDAAAEQLVTQFEKVHREYSEYPLNRPVMIHAQLVQEPELMRMKKLTMTPSFFVAHTWYWGDIHIENFGKERADRISPAGTAVRLGLPFTFHQDSPVLKPDELETVWCAVRRITKNGVKLSEAERISVYEALKAVTVNGALQYFEENEKGSVEEGKLADLIILDKNPLEVPVDEIKNIRVLETFKEGRSIYKRKNL